MARWEDASGDRVERRGEVLRQRPEPLRQRRAAERQGERSAEGGTAGDAEHEGVGERVAQERLPMVRCRGLLEEQPCDALASVQAEAAQKALP